MVKTPLRRLAGCMAALLLFSNVSALAVELTAESPQTEYTYGLDGLGTLSAATAEPLGDSATLYTYQVAGSAPQTVFACEVDPLLGGFVRGENLGTSLPSRKKVSAAGAVGEDVHRLVGVNADFFSFSTGVPMGLLVENGVYQTASDGRDALCITEDGEVFLGKPEETLTVTFGETELPVSYLNKYPSYYGIYLQTRAYGETAGIPSGLAVTEVIFALDGELHLGGSTPAKVVEIRNAETENVGTAIPEGCVSMVIPDLYARSADYRIFAVDDEVTFTVECDERYQTVVNAVGGGDVILRDGEVVDGTADEDHEKTRQPRTAFGITAEGKLLFFVIDGRQSGYSLGVKLYDLAKAMQALGCTDAINFDGGGSTALVRFDGEKPTVVNTPSDKAERAVTNALFAYEPAVTDGALPRLDGKEPAEVLFYGTTAEIPLTLLGNDDFVFTEDNTTLTFDSRIGEAYLSDGKLYFTAGDIDGVGKLHVAVETENGITETDVFPTVTNRADKLTVAYELLLTADEPLSLTVTATRNGKGVAFGNALTASVADGDGYTVTVDGNTVTLVGDGATSLTLSLGDCTRILPVYGDNAPLGDYLHAVSVKTDGETAYTVEKSDNGVLPGSAYTLLPNLPEEEPSVEALPPQSTDSAVAEAPAEDTDASTDKDTAADSIPTEDTPPAPEPTATGIEVTAALSANLAGKRIWLWADGLEETSSPYARFTVDGTETILPYEILEDTRSFNGRALLTLLLPDAKTVTLLSPLGYSTFTDGVTRFGPFFAAKAYDPNRFTDLTEHWSKSYVTTLAYMDVISGSEDLTGKLVFRPDDGLTREQFAKLLVGYLQLAPADFLDTELDFADAADISPWAIPYVQAAVGAGLMRGKTTPQDTLIFAPQDGITREEALYVLGGLLSDPTASAELNGFTDAAKIAPWATEHLSAALAASLISGYDDGSIRPQGKITRAEASTVLVKLWRTTK